ncbi:MAG: fumarylacetoacetate hydrolase family protein [Deltaproteobacteria bacterium]|nr:fumarylacetoacetate hydrolase family protein [Deltaproteobacteria bacterium]
MDKQLFQIDIKDIRNMYFVGRNYIEHVEELHNQKPEHPLIFNKPVSTIARDYRIPYPAHSSLLHFEGEMVFVLARDTDMAEGSEMLVGSGIDFTARDVQNIAKEKGWPWFEAKAFRGSTVISDHFFKCRVSDFKHLSIQTTVNGKIRQKGSYTQKLFSVADILTHLRRVVDIVNGDILFTGTPSGVGEVKRGDNIEAALLFQNEIKTKLTCEVD